MSQQNKKRILYLRFPAYLLFLVLFVIRMFDVYRDGAIMQLDCQITTGIMKGIYTEENRAQAYEKTVNIMRQEISPEDHVVVLGCNPWVYLDSEARCGSYTTWQFVEGEDFLEKYYDIFPEKVPDIILKVPDNLSKFEYWRFSSHGVGMNSISDNGLNTILNQIIREKNYICQEIGDMIVYRGF